MAISTPLMVEILQHFARVFPNVPWAVIHPPKVLQVLPISHKGWAISILVKLFVKVVGKPFGQFPAILQEVFGDVDALHIVENGEVKQRAFKEGS